MNLSQLAITLGTFLFLHSVNAMEIPEKEQLDTTRAVKVRVWKEGHQILENSSPTIASHISLETNERYMSTHLYSKILETFKLPTKGTQDPTTCCFAIFNFKKDQEHLGDPKETYILHLNTQSMNALWEQLTDVLPVDKLYKNNINTIGYTLPKNVVYHDGSDRKDSSSLPQSTFENEKLYFNNATLVKGLLHAGGIKKIQQKIIRFKNIAGTSSADIFSSYDDVIKCNTHIRDAVVNVQDLENMVKLAIKHQTLVRIEEEIQKMGMTYLNTHHDKGIVDRILEKDKSFLDVCADLQQLKTTYENDQSYFSFNGWYNFVTGEWK